MPTYRVFGLTIDSQIAIPSLAEAPGKADAQVTFEYAPDEVAFGNWENALRDDRVFDMQLDGIRYLVAEGNRIDITAPRGIDMGLVTGWLTGQVLGTLLVQRGRLALHANAVVLPNGKGLAAFAGPSGAGKSTLAAMLERRGYDMFCDDLLAIDGASGTPMVDRGVPRIKLWRETLDHLGISAADLDPVIARADKYQMPLSVNPAAPERLPLRRIYLLEQSATGPAIDRVRGAEAGALVVDNAYRWAAASLWHGGDDWGFERCLDLARTCEVYRFSRLFDFGRAEDALVLLEQHLAQ
ncbi:hypothetical protein [Sphingomicrobium clamense]|uniref:Hpr(Ser) kinase/phosphatase n=1 Tax=Sphingomicrobium clamense TaxID=2851013 RepID=A0ABS6V2F1_9SPHN|nr:hypothetical protein [Sphingomicrobium sp. B8]MBW0143743.1 hypothetical protein [Sphingomicrobium sp. B8]